MSRRFSALAAAVLFAASIGVPTGAALAAKPALSDVVKKVQTIYESVKDLKAEFQQQTRYEGFETVVESKGMLQLKKPGKLRWDYRDPAGNQVYVRENQVWIYTPEQKQVIVTAMTQMSDSQLPLHLLTGAAQLDRDFEVRWTEPARDDLALTLVPRDAKSGLEKIEIQLDPKRYLITQVKLFEQNGNTSAFQFNGIKVNTGIDDTLFVFKAPKGTEIIQQPLGP